MNRAHTEPAFLRKESRKLPEGKTHPADQKWALSNRQLKVKGWKIHSEESFKKLFLAKAGTKGVQQHQNESREITMLQRRPGLALDFSISRRRADGSGSINRHVIKLHRIPPPPHTYIHT